MDKISKELLARREAQLARRRGGKIGHMSKRMPVPEHLLDKKNFAYRLVNDGPGRVHRLTTDDTWDVVKPSEGGTVDFHSGRDEGGQSVRAVLVRKPVEWFQEDQAAKQKEIDRKMSAIMQKPVQPDAVPAEQAQYFSGSMILED